MLTHRTSQSLRSRWIHLLNVLGVLALALALVPAASAATGWSAPVDVSAVAEGTFGDQVAFDEAGDAVAVWQQWQDGPCAIQAATRPAGGTWSAPVDVATTALFCGNPQIALDARGDAVVAWEGFENYREIDVSTHTAGALAWSIPVTLSDPKGDASEPRVAVGENGQAALAWLAEGAAGQTTVHVVSAGSVGAPWSPPEEISAPGQNATYPQIAIDGSGSTIAVWQRPNATGTAIQESGRSPSGGWSIPVNLSASGQTAWDPHLAVDAAGDAAVAWEHSVAGHDLLQVTTRAAGGGWRAPQTVSPAEEGTDPLIALDGRGDAVLAWSKFIAGGERFVCVSEEQAGTGVWSVPVQLSSPNLEEPEASLAVDPAGDAVIAWQVGSGAAETVEVASRPAGGTWLAPADLSAPAEDGTEPRAAIDPQGDAVVVWRQYANGKDLVQASTLDMSTEAVGDPTGAGGTVATAPAPTSDATTTQPSSSPAPAPGTAAPPAKARCPKGKTLRRVKVRVPAKAGAKRRFKTKTVARCVKPHKRKPARQHRKGK
jgi:hypothetical protein